MLGPLLFSHQAHGALGWGGLLSCTGVGAVIGSALATRCQPRYPLRFAVCVFFSYALFPAGLAAHLPYGGLAVCAVINGISVPIFGVLWNTLVQTKIPQDKISRVMSYEYAGSLSATPLGLMLAVPLAHFLSPAGALWVGVGALVVSNIAVLLVKDVWMLQAEPKKT